MIYGTPQAAADRCEIVNCYPEHVRKQVVEILKTGNVCKEWISNEDILCYLAVSPVSLPLKQACEEKLLDGLNSVNCVDALEIADSFDLLRLRKEATSLIVEGFSKIWESPSFRCLGEKSLERLCTLEKIAKHPDIYQALENWLELKHEERFHFYCRLLEVVQVQRSQRLCPDVKRCYTSYHAMLMSSTSKSKNSVVAAVFNCDREMVCHRKLFKSSEIKDKFSIACVQKDENEAPYVYINSGRHVFRYDPLLNKDETCANLNHTRIGSSLVSVNGCLYAIGGQNKDKNVQEIEELHLKQNEKASLKTQWKVVCKLPGNIQLQSAPCAVYENKVYIVASLKIDDETSTAIVVFNPYTKSMDKIAEFPQKCSNCKTVVHGTNLYIASSDGLFIKFDLNTKIFTSCADLPIKSSHFGLYVNDNNIYAVLSGSNDKNDERLKMAGYDISTQSWKRVKAFSCNLSIYGNCDIKVPSYANVIPFYDTKFKEIKS